MIKIGDEVGWLWGNGMTTGKVIEIYFEKHQIISKGKTITRNGTPEDPALVIKHKSGNQVIKLAHEVQKL